MSDITCPKCGHTFEMNDVLKNNMMKELECDHKKEMDDLEERIRSEEKKNALEQKNKAVDDALKKQSVAMDELVEQIKSLTATNKELHDKLMGSIDQNTKLQEQKNNLDIEYANRLNTEKEELRKRITAEVTEAKENEIKQLNSKLEETKKAAEDAVNKAKQGSQQTQGEVLEVELEDCLRDSFRNDLIEEVKKGERGADVRQFVRYNGNDCGLILWETKNAKWSDQWIPKLKGDMQKDKATLGVLVSVNMPENMGDFTEIDGIWVIRPRFAIQVSQILRNGLIGVYKANTMSQNKDAKMDFAFRYITGPEFRNRVIAIIDNYRNLQTIHETEVRTTKARWAKQEKAIEMVIENTSGLYGDFQGILGPELECIKELEPPD